VLWCGSFASSLLIVRARVVNYSFTTHWTFLPHIGHFYHTLDIFTTHWTFLPHIGHFYHTLDIFTTHWTFLPHIGYLYHTLDIFTTHSPNYHTTFGYIRRTRDQWHAPNLRIWLRARRHARTAPRKVLGSSNARFARPRTAGEIARPGTGRVTRRTAHRRCLQSRGKPSRWRAKGPGWKPLFRRWWKTKGTGGRF